MLLSSRLTWFTLALLALVPAQADEPGPKFEGSLARAVSAPWDGAAFELLLFEPPAAEQPKERFLSVRVWHPINELLGKTVKLDGKDEKQGAARWWPTAKKWAPAGAVTLEFQKGSPTAPVEGTFLIHWPDGKTSAGRFKAKWLPSPPPG